MFLITHKYLIYLAVAMAAPIVLTACGGSGGGGGSKSVELTWVAPTQRSDSTFMGSDEIAGYVVRYGQDPLQLGQTVYTDCVANTCGVDVRGLTAGRWYFTVQTIDTTDLTSVPSKPVSVTL